MDLKIPRIIENLPLADYAPEFGEVSLPIWVNPPRKLLEQMNEIARAAVTGGLPEGREQEAAGIIGQLWGCSDTDVLRIVEHSADTDPKLFAWLLLRTFRMIEAHRQAVKKN